MENAEYSFWYEQAKKNVDVKVISEHYLENREVVRNYLEYIQKEENAWKELLHLLVDTDLDYVGLEDTILKYGGGMQNVYLELGMKIGAKLGAEYLLNSLEKESVL